MIQTQGNNLDGAVSQARVSRLNKFTKAGLTYQSRKDYHRMALCIAVIYNEKLFLESGSENIYDYAKEHFNIQRGSTSNYLTVARKFLDSNTGTSVFIDNNVDFDITQLVKLKKLSVKEVRELLECGAISFDSTTKEIEESVNNYFNQIKTKEQKAKDDSLKPLTEAYEKFHAAFNELNTLVTGDRSKELMQEIMDCVVLLYNENDRLWN